MLQALIYKYYKGLCTSVAQTYARVLHRLMHECCADLYIHVTNINV